MLLACAQRHLPLLPLFLRCVRELPTATTDEVTMSRRIDSHTGGVGLNSSVSPTRTSEEDLAAYVFISGKALEHKVRAWVRTRRCGASRVGGG